MFKIHRRLSTDILREIFVPKISSYNLRRNNTFGSRQVHSVCRGTELLSFLGPNIWDLVPLELKQLESLQIYKLKIKKWIPFECPCRLCQTYVQQVGFLWSSKTDHDDCYYHFYHLRFLYDNIYYIYSYIYI